MAIERLIMCIRSGSNSGIYCLTNLVGKGSRAQLVVFDFMTNLRTSSSETTSCHIMVVEEYNPLSRWHGRQFVTFDMANAFSIRNTRRLPDIHEFSQQTLLGSTTDMWPLVTVVEMRALSSAHWQPFRFFGCN